MRLGACITVLLVLAGAPAALGDEPDVAVQLEEILAELDASSSRAVEKAVKRLQALGPNALPDLLDAYWSHPARQLKGGQAERHEATASLAALSKAIQANGVPALADHLERYVAEHPDGCSRLRALEILAHFGDEDIMPLAVELVSDLPPEWRGSRRVAQIWATALRDVMAHGMSPRMLRRTLDRMPEELRHATAHVVRERGRHSELKALVDLVERGGSHVGPVLLELSRAPAVATRRLELAAATRRQLQHGDPEARQGAAALAGRRRIVVIFPELVAQLDHEDKRVRTAAEAALREMTSTSLGPRAEAWTQWYEAESRWLESASVAARLEDQDAGEVSRALREIADHRLKGLSFVSEVRALLEHETAGVRILACATLGALGDAEAVPDLIDLLRVRHQYVREAAWRALVGLTGEQMPPDYDPWHVAFRRWIS